MNPARSIGPALVSGGDALRQLWVRILAPLVDAALASVFLYRAREEEATVERLRSCSRAERGLRIALGDLPDAATRSRADDLGAMKEMVFVGRGGEGVVLASQLLAETFARTGFWVQSFPEFKAERRGAPISAFLRWDDAAPIHRRYRVRECDVLVDVSSVEPSAQALASVRPDGLVLLNRETRYAHAAPFDVARVPASRIARAHGILSSEGRPMANTALLGACVRLLLPHGLAALEQAIGARMGANARVNATAARAGYAAVTRQRTLAGDAPLDAATAQPAPRRRTLFPVSSIDSRGNLTGGWSLERPLLGEACTACGVCALFCPEGAIARDGERMAIDLRYCKGCGICEVVCPVRDALAMEAVPA